MFFLWKCNTKPNICYNHKKMFDFLSTDEVPKDCLALGSDGTNKSQYMMEGWNNARNRKTFKTYGCTDKLLVFVV